MSTGYQTHIPPNFHQQYQQNIQLTPPLSRKHKITLVLGVLTLVVMIITALMTCLSPHFQAEIRKFLGFSPTGQASTPVPASTQPTQTSNTINIPHPPLTEGNYRKVEIMIEEGEAPIVKAPVVVNDDATPKKDTNAHFEGEWAILDRSAPTAYKAHRHIFLRALPNNEFALFNAFDQKIGWGTYSLTQMNGIWLIPIDTKTNEEGHFDAKIISSNRIEGVWVSGKGKAEIILYRP